MVIWKPDNTLMAWVKEPSSPEKEICQVTNQIPVQTSIKELSETQFDEQHTMTLGWTKPAHVHLSLPFWLVFA